LKIISIFDKVIVLKGSSYNFSVNSTEYDSG